MQSCSLAVSSPSCSILRLCNNNSPSLTIMKNRHVRKFIFLSTCTISSTAWSTHPHNHFVGSSSPLASRFKAVVTTGALGGLQRQPIVGLIAWNTEPRPRGQSHGQGYCWSSSRQFSSSKQRDDPPKVDRAVQECADIIKQAQSHSNRTDADEDEFIEFGDLPDAQVEKETMDWLKRVVIGLNLCPFADRPLREGKINLFIIRGSDVEAILGAILYQSMRQKEISGTTLVVAPECFPDDFKGYLDIVTTFEEDFMEQNDLDGYIQIAPFHPNFEFQGSGEDGVDNYTNKSPFPTFHVLRHDEVEWAVDKLGGDAGKVWKRNVKLLEDLQETIGTEGVNNIMSGKALRVKAGELGKVMQRNMVVLPDTKDS